MLLDGNVVAVLIGCELIAVGCVVGISGALSGGEDDSIGEVESMGVGAGVFTGAGDAVSGLGIVITVGVGDSVGDSSSILSVEIGLDVGAMVSRNKSYSPGIFIGPPPL